MRYKLEFVKFPRQNCNFALPSAKTGDESNLLLWLTILSVAAIGVGVARKKRKA